MFVTFHGSWNRQPPIGYELAIVEFGNDGQPRANADTKDPQKKVLWNEDLSICPKQCFRPTGAAVGPRGEVYVSGDSTGDIWIVRRSGANGEDTKGGAAKFRSVGLAATVMMMWWNVVL